MELGLFSAARECKAFSMLGSVAITAAFLLGVPLFDFFKKFLYNIYRKSKTAQKRKGVKEMEKEFVSYEKNKCAACGSMELEYCDKVLEEDEVYYYSVCKECGAAVCENYHIFYSNTTAIIEE